MRMNLHDIDAVKEVHTPYLTEAQLQAIYERWQNPPNYPQYVRYLRNPQYVYYAPPTVTWADTGMTVEERDAVVDEVWQEADPYYRYEVRATDLLPNRVDGVFLDPET
jgi:hypothetical protein